MVLCTLVLDCTASRAPSDWASVREVTPSFLLALEATDPALAADEHGRVALTFVTRDSTGKNLWPRSPATAASPSPPRSG